MIFTQSRTMPIVAPTTTTAIGARNAICSSEYFVTAAPTSQIDEHDDDRADRHPAIATFTR